MSTRHHLVTVPLAALLLLGVAACGDDAASPAGGVTAVEPAPQPTTSAAPSAPPAAEPAPAEGTAAATPAGEPEPDFDGTVVEVRYAGGEVVTAEPRVVVPLGSTVRLVVTSDVADEVHVHGVDEYVPLTPGAPASRDVVASIPGIFEVELHDAGDLLLTLQVEP